jgi:hypothetical protein
MAILISKNSLLSRTARSAVTSGLTRKIDLDYLID